MTQQEKVAYAAELYKQFDPEDLPELAEKWKSELLKYEELDPSVETVWGQDLDVLAIRELAAVTEMFEKLVCNFANEPHGNHVDFASG